MNDMKKLDETKLNWGLLQDIVAKVTPVSQVDDTMFADDSTAEIVNDRIIRRTVATVLEEISKKESDVSEEIKEKIEELAKEYKKTQEYDPLELLSIIKDNESIMSRRSPQALQILVDSQIDSVLRDSIELDAAEAGYDVTDRKKSLGEVLGTELEKFTTKEVSAARIAKGMGYGDLYSVVQDDFLGGSEAGAMRDKLTDAGATDKDIERLLTILERVAENTDPEAGVTQADRLAEQSRKEAEFDAFKTIADNLENSKIANTHLEAASAMLGAGSASEFGAAASDVLFGGEDDWGLAGMAAGSPLMAKAMPLLLKGGAVAAAGFAGWQLGDKVINPLIDKAVQAATGEEDASLGSWLYDVFNDDPVIMATVNQMDAEGVIEKRGWGRNSKIKDWAAIEKLHVFQIDDLIKYGDWSDGDLSKLKAARLVAEKYWANKRAANAAVTAAAVSNLPTYSGVREGQYVDTSQPGALLLANPPTIDKASIKTPTNTTMVNKTPDGIDGSALGEGRDFSKLQPHQQKFIEEFGPIAEQVGKELGVDPRIILAQSAQETGWGKSLAGGNNYFGIKSHGWKGKSQNVGTFENYNDKITDSFRGYASAEESAANYIDFLRTNPRYAESLKRAQEGDTRGFIKGLESAGYATAKDEFGNPTYANSIWSIAKGLPQFSFEQKDQSEVVDVKLADESLAKDEDSETPVVRADAQSSQTVADTTAVLKEPEKAAESVASQDPIVINAPTQTTPANKKIHELTSAAINLASMHSG